MKKIVFIILAIVTLSFSAKCNNPANVASNMNLEKPALKGQIIDNESGEALTGVAVYIDNELKTYTDFDGNYKIKNLAPGKYNVKLKFVSYKEIKKEVELKNKSKELNISLVNFE